MVATMEVFLMVKRRKLTIFLDASETTTVLEVKKMIQGIVKQEPDDQRLFKGDTVLEDKKTLADCGINVGNSKAQAPVRLGLAHRGEDGNFEELVIDPLSTPPELPDVMKQEDSAIAKS